MIDVRAPKAMTRRELLRGAAWLAGAAVLTPAVPAWARAFSLPQAAADPLGKMRAQIGSAPIERLALTDTLTMLSGPGGNVVVLHGPDGKIVVDSFVQPAWGALKQALDGMGGARISALIDTHWHFDHADNNANFRKAGASVVAHENTRKRLTQTHELLGMKIPAAPAEALPTETFKDRLDCQHG